MGSWAEVEVEAGNADDRNGSSIHMLFELLYISQLHGHIHGIQRMIRILGYRVVEMRHAQGSDRYLKTQVQTRARVFHWRPAEYPMRRGRLLHDQPAQHPAAPAPARSGAQARGEMVLPGC